mmetsp:Transcript_2327/g.8975  ORF Transcript_2327/g.8975 Transcript_2327/m.8975 type:complete len:246 (-) Transcript_2327:484-1221(-)
MCTCLSPPPHQATRAPSARHAKLETAFGASKVCVHRPCSASHRRNVLSSPPLQTADGDSHCTDVTALLWPISTSSSFRAASGLSVSPSTSIFSSKQLRRVSPPARVFFSPFRRFAEPALFPSPTAVVSSTSPPPSLRHTRAVPSLLALAKNSPPGALATATTAAVCPTNARAFFADADAPFFFDTAQSQLRTIPSCAPATNTSPSSLPFPLGNRVTEVTALFAAFATGSVSNNRPPGVHNLALPS